MNGVRAAQRIGRRIGLGILLLAPAAGPAWSTACAQTDASAGKVVGDKAAPAKAEQDEQDRSAGKIVGEPAGSQKTEAAPQTKHHEPAQSATETAEVVAPSLTQRPAERKRTAWQLLKNAANDEKKVETRIQALAALGMLRSPESERMIGNAMLDSDLDVRTAAVLAAGQTRDPNLTTSLRNLLDDKEPQVAFTAAMTLARMGDRSGEDILMAVVDGDRETQAGGLHGAEHKISRDLRNPSKLARLGAMQGAAMLLGPFGFGLTAIEFMRRSGGDAARAAAIEQIAQERTEPIHRELLDALQDKDPGVRAAAAKALVDYHDQPTQDAVYTLLLDPKDPARLTAAAAYLRITGVPGPMPGASAKARARTRRPQKRQ